jgi:hypothetical protein
MHQYRKHFTITTATVILGLVSCSPINENIFKLKQSKYVVSVQKIITSEEQMSQKIERFRTKFYAEFPELEKYKKPIEIKFINSNELEKKLTELTDIQNLPTFPESLIIAKDNKVTVLLPKGRILKDYDIAWMVARAAFEYAPVDEEVFHFPNYNFNTLFYPEVIPNFYANYFANKFEQRTINIVHPSDALLLFFINQIGKVDFIKTYLNNDKEKLIEVFDAKFGKGKFIEMLSFSVSDLTGSYKFVENLKIKNDKVLFQNLKKTAIEFGFDIKEDWVEIWK